MARPRRLYCRSCDKHVSEVGELSARGKCATCGDAAHLANTASLRAREGEPYEHWRLRSAWAVGAVPLEQVRRMLAEARDQAPAA